MNPSAQLSRTTSRLGNLCVFCVLGSSLVLLVSVGANESFAQTWPSKPLRVVVPFTAASATDTIARIVAERLGSQLGQTLVVENRPGAGGTIGVGTVARAEADGYTLLVHSSSFTVTPTTYPNTPYDTLRDFSGVTPLGNLPNVLVIAPSRNIRSVKELVAAAKAKPGALTYASAGAGSATQLNAERFRLGAGPVVDRDVVALTAQMTRHWRAHDSQTDESNLSHSLTSLSGCGHQHHTDVTARWRH